MSEGDAPETKRMKLDSPSAGPSGRQPAGWMVSLHLPAFAPIRVSWNRDDDVHEVATRVASEHVLARGYLAPIAQWLRDRMRDDDEALTTASAPLSPSDEDDPFRVIPVELSGKLFRYLSLADRVHCDLSGGCLSSLAKAAWSAETTLDTTSCEWEKLSCTCHASRSQVASAILTICERIGEHLNTLVLSTALPLDLAVIARLCPNVAEIEFTAGAYDFSGIAPSEFSFASFVNVKRLSFSHFGFGFFTAPFVSPQFLLRVPPALEVFRGSVGANLSASQFEDFFRKCSTLREVALSGTSLQYNQCARLFPVISEHCQSLKSISCTGDVSANGIQKLTGMKEVIFGQPADMNTSSEQIIEFCERNTELESFAILGQIIPLNRECFNAVARLRVLTDLRFPFALADAATVDSSVVELIESSGTTLRNLDLYASLRSAPVAALGKRSIEAIAKTCANLRYLECVVVGAEVIPGIRSLVDLVTGSRSFDASKDVLEVALLYCGDPEDHEADDVYDALEAAVELLVGELPAGVNLSVRSLEH